MFAPAVLKFRFAWYASGSAVQSDRSDMPFIKMLMRLEKIGDVIGTGIQSLRQRRQRRTVDDHHRAIHFNDGSYDLAVFLLCL